MKLNLSLIFLIPLLFLAPWQELKAQTAEWATPTRYAALCNYQGNAYKYYRDGHVGLIDYSGQEITPAAYDSITDFTAGYGLALQQVGANYSVKAIIDFQSNQYRVHPVSEQYFVTKYYAYFSEGKMPVCNASGVFGYMDTGGNLVIPMQFSVARPFFEGYASVKRTDNKQHVFYINGEGRILQIEPGNGAIIYGTTFSNGEAVVYTLGKKGYVINTEGKTVRSYSKDVNAVNQSINRRDYTLAGMEHQSYFEPFKIELTANPIEPFQENALWGYRKGSQVVLPPQFESADKFRNGFARVKVTGSYRFLHLVNDGFSGRLDMTSTEVHGSKGASVSYSLNVPAGYHSQNLMLEVTGNGHQYNVSNKGQSARGYSFEFVPEPNAKEKSQTLDFVLRDGNLKLFVDKQTLNFKYPVSLKLGEPFAVQEKAGEDDKFPLQVYIENASATAQHLTATFHVEGYGSFDIDINIGAGKTERATVVVPDIKTERLCKVHVTLSNGLKSRSAQILIKPFY